MTRTLVPLRDTAIAPAGDEPTVSPAKVYLSGLAETGRRSMASALDAVARILTPDVPEANAENTAWWKVRYEHVQAIRAVLVERYKPRTVNRMLAAVRGVLTVAWNMKLLATDDYQRAVKVKSVPKQAQAPAGRALDVAELERLFEACDEMPSPEGVRAAAIISVLYGAGLRRDELTRLDLEHYNPRERSLNVRGKGGKNRIAYVVSELAGRLDKWRALRGSKGPFFVRLDRQRRILEKRLGYTGLERALEAVQARAGIRCTPHDLRRSFGTHLLDQGVDIATVKNLMGHADIATTTIYDRRDEAGKRKAIQSLPVPGAKNETVNVTRSSRITLDEIFATGTSFGETDPRNVATLEKEIQLKNVVVEVVRLPENGVGVLKDFSGRTDEHRKLCSQAAAWLESQDRKWSVRQKDLYYPGGVADVFGGGRLFVECGYTKASKVLEALAHKRDVLVCPYLEDDIGFWFKRRKKMIYERTRREHLSWNLDIP